MKLTKLSNTGNLTIIGKITYRMAFNYFIVLAFAAIIFNNAIFRWNILAIIGYFAFASIIIGQTPTTRSLMYNVYGILFKKPTKMVVSELATLNTIGHGIKDIEFDNDIDMPAFKTRDNKYALIYTVSSSITNWSTDVDIATYANSMKTVFNLMDGGDSIFVVNKQDNDTSMLKLREMLETHEKWEGDDFAALSNKRKQVLNNVATSDQGRSVQQYVIIKTNKKNLRLIVRTVKRAMRLMRPSSYPIDILLAATGFEGGIEYTKIKVGDK